MGARRRGECSRSQDALVYVFIKGHGTQNARNPSRCGLISRRPHNERWDASLLHDVFGYGTKSHPGKAASPVASHDDQIWFVLLDILENSLYRMAFQNSDLMRRLSRDRFIDQLFQIVADPTPCHLS